MWADGLFEFCKTKNNNFVIIFSIVWLFLNKFTRVYFSLSIPPIYGTMFTARSTKFLWKPRVISKQLKLALHSHQNRTALPKAFSLAWFSRQIRYRNPWNFCPWNWKHRKFCFWHPESWALGSEIQLKESGIPLTIEIQNPTFTEKDWKWALVSGIHCVESRIKNCLGFPYMGR